ncbi:MAG: bifunctional oligoribonuclease/PAP phosphatase NrnA [Deltaproteobacteria bacterium]|jgi:phosphoesterase RecJ-like protein|nr:bifunctional oligoribonuclease/PAP phosphatase NrnA [Deltaproteobacteria bacterium]
MTSSASPSPYNPAPPKNLLDCLREAKRVLIIGHQSPDGDAMGSALALGLALSDLGGQVTVGHAGTFPKSLEFLTMGKSFVAPLPFGENLPTELAAKFDLMVLVDCQTPLRVWPDADRLPGVSFPPFAVIDHHADNAAAGCLASFVDQRASATAELVFKIIEALEVEFTPPIVEALLAALISDTGSFSQANSTAECLRQASFLVSKGGDIEYINHYLKRNWSITRMRLLTETLTTIDLHRDGRLATMVLTQEMLNETGSCLAEAEGLVEYPLLLHGVDMVAFFRVNGQGKTRVSLRSRPGIDVRELARSQGGGGHKQAAAYIDESPLPQVALKRLLSLLDSLDLPEISA